MSFSYLLFSFQGRIGRAGFWLGIWLVIAFCVAAGVLTVQFDKVTTSPIIVALPFVLNFMLAAVMVKRFHDRGKSGWWAIIATIPPVLFGATGGQPDSFVQGVIAALALGVGFWFLFELGISRGQQGSNRFGAASSLPSRAPRAVVRYQASPTILPRPKPIAPQFHAFSHFKNIIGSPRITIAAVAIAVVSFLFIHEPGISIIGNTFFGKIYLMDECPIAQTKTEFDYGKAIEEFDRIEKLANESFIRKVITGDLFQCDLAIPYRWILAFVVGVIAVNFMARLRR